jgi:hypothetical protein
MTKRDIASLSIKLMGVFILLKSIAYIPMTFSGMFSVMHSQGWLFAVFVVLISIVVAGIPLVWSLLVIFFSDKAAAWLIKDDSPAEITGDPMTKGDVMAVAISCIGLYFIVAAAPLMIHALINNTIQVRQQIAFPLLSPSRMMNLLKNMAVPAVQLALGIWLFVGSRAIVNLWKKIRS